jgi:hypothetical protein
MMMPVVFPETEMLASPTLSLLMLIDLVIVSPP